MRLTNLNIPARFTDDDFKDKEVNRFRMNYPDMILFRQTYSSEMDLARDKARWDMMGYDQRLISNEVSLRLFGAKNEDRYPRLKAKFTKEDIKNTDLDNTYSSSLKTYTEEFMEYGETFNAALNLERNKLVPFKFYTVIRESSDIIEQLYFIESLQKLDTGNSVVSKILKEQALSIKEELLEKPTDEINPIGYCVESYFTPHEIKEIGIRVTNESWYRNFKARCYGFTIKEDFTNHLYNPAMLKEGKESLNKNSYPKVSKRLNETLSKEIFTNREFIDLTEVSAYGAMSDKAVDTIKGIYVYFIHTIIDDKLTTEIGIGLDPRSNKVYKFECGRIYREVDLKELYHSKDDFMVLYFIPLTDELYSKVSEKLLDMKTKNYHIKNFIKDICDALNIEHLNIMNEKLFFAYLIHLLISLSGNHDGYISDDLTKPNKKIYSYILYKGEVGDFDRFGNGSPLAKLNMYTESYINGENLLEGYFRMKKLDMQVLLESNENDERDLTGFNRIKYNDYIERTTKYSVE